MKNKRVVVKLPTTDDLVRASICKPGELSFSECKKLRIFRNSSGLSPRHIIETQANMCIRVPGDRKFYPG